nr:DUF924 domain-containing protein [Bacteriovorax sp. HI3]
MNYQEIIDFWFREIKPENWFKKSDSLDLLITERYIALHASVVAGEHSSWRNEALGRLAEIIVIDQFSRNIYRDDPKSFIYDPMALALAQEAVRSDIHKDFSPALKQFLYMPFMHSESKLIHQTAMMLFAEPGLEANFDYELKHKEVIDRFGRYPERNKALGRVNTPEEEAYLMDNAPLYASATIKEEIRISH